MLGSGDHFGDYTVVSRLGKGGMGAVYLLESMSGVRIAAKILEPELGAKSHEFRRRFLREAQIAMNVKHRNLIEVYDIGEDPDSGLCYILMEYVGGGSLQDRLVRDGRVPVREAVALVRSIASVLQTAHERGIVHRDIKPGNILFTADGVPKLADLGIAQVSSSPSQTTVTTTGMMIGTPAYMSPEQMMNSHDVDVRADIYSLGIVFYEMIAGHRPNESDTVIQMMAKAIKGEPIPDVRTLRPEVSASVAQLINLMCEMDVARRIGDPEAIIKMTRKIDRDSDYVNVLAGGEGIERKSPQQDVARHLRGRFLMPRWGLAAAAAVAAVVLAFSLGRTFSERHRDDAVSEASIRAETKPVVAEVKPMAADTDSVADLDMNVARPAAVADESQDFGELAAPVRVQYPMETRAIVACDLTPRASEGPFAYLARSSSDGGIFGRDVVAVPQLFPFTDADLAAVNVAIIASESSRYPYAAKEVAALKRFVENGGLLVVLVNGPLSSGSSCQGCGILKDWGLEATEITDRSRDRFKIADDALGRGPIFGTGTVYFTPSGQWRTHAAQDADATKAGICSLRMGKGMVVAVAGLSLFQSNFAGRSDDNRTGVIDFPWRKLFAGRIRPMPSSAASYEGQTFEQAPCIVRSKRYAFGSGVHDAAELRSIADCADEVDGLLEAQFGAGILGTTGPTNVLVCKRNLFFLRQRFARMGVIELPVGYGEDKPKFALARCALGAHPIFRAARGPLPIDDFMVDAALCGGANAVPIVTAIKMARESDPDFKLYDRDGRPRAGTTPALKIVFAYQRGRGYAVLAELWRRHPTMFLDYRRRLAQIETASKRFVSPRECEILLSEVTGEDVTAIIENPSLLLGEGKNVVVFGERASFGARAVIGCDLLPGRGSDDTYCSLKGGSMGGMFGVDAVTVPFHFRIDAKALATVNVMVMNGEMGVNSCTPVEIAALRRFVKDGGLLLSLIHSTHANPVRISCEMATAVAGEELSGWNIGRGEARGKVKVVDGSLDPKTLQDDVNVYFVPGGNWRVHATFENDLKKAVVCSKRVGKGLVVAAPASLIGSSGSYAGSVRRSLGFPWRKLLAGKVQALSTSAAEPKGHTFSQAPFTARSKRYTFGSGVVEPAELKRLAEMADDIDRHLERRFGPGFLETTCVSNVLVGQVTNFKSQLWQRRMAEMGVVELDTFGPRPLSGGGIQSWVAVKFIKAIIQSRRPDVVGSMGYGSVEDYMAETILDELMPQHTFWFCGNYEGKTRALRAKDSYRARMYVALDALGRRHPSMFLEYRKRILAADRIGQRNPDGGVSVVSEAEAMKILSEVTGEDVAALVKNPAPAQDDGTGRKGGTK